MLMKDRFCLYFGKRGNNSQDLHKFCDKNLTPLKFIKIRLTLKNMPEKILGLKTFWVLRAAAWSNL